MTAIQEGNKMYKFWESQSSDFDSSDESREEIPEIIGLLPSASCILELGAGTGRFSGKLAEKCKTLHVVDFMKARLAKNKQTNGHHSNIIFMEADVTTLDFPENSFDLVFSNWLLMYLEEEQVLSLLTKVLKWLKPGGHFFFRESCFHESEKKSQDSNPTIYRKPALYNAYHKSVGVPNVNGKTGSSLELVLSRSIQAYVKHKNNSNQVCWLLQKVQSDQADNHGFKTFQEFLDNQQYSVTGILRYEKIFGHNFVSTGGKETTEEFVSMLNLKPGQKVLDVGSGIGGSAFLMAQKYGAEVLGIDLSANMIAIGLERANEIKDNRVQFEVGDATKRQFADSSFDVIYSRDTILHIKDKRALFSNFLTWLKPGGKLLISDYTCREGQWSEVFQKYVSQRGYHLLSVPLYGKLLEEVGFVNVKAEDRTEQFVQVLNKELARAKSIKDEFISEFSQKDYDAIVNGWSDKLVRCGNGDQKWGLFYAEKSVVQNI